MIKAFARRWTWRRGGQSSNCGGFMANGGGLDVLEPRMLLSGGVCGSANGSGTLTMSYYNDQGVLTVMQEAQSGSAQRYDTFDGGLATPALAAPPITWADPVDGLTYGAAPSDSGLIVFKQYSGGAWGWEAMSNALQAPAISNLTVFIGKDASVNIAGVQTNGDVALVTKSADGAWHSRNLSDDLRAQGIATPVFVSGLVSYTTDWDGRNIAGLDGSGQIQAIWWAPGQALWTASNLSQITGAPTLSGSLCAYLTGWGGINLAGTDADGTLLVTWWVPDFKGSWVTSDLTESASGPTMDVGGLSSYVTPWGGLNLVGRDASGVMSVYWWAPGMNAWVASVDLAPGSPSLASDITGIASPTGIISLVGQLDDGSVARYYFDPVQPGVWHFENISAKSAPAPMALDNVDVDFLELTGLGRASGGSWTYALEDPEQGITATGHATSTPLGNQTFRWEMSASNVQPFGTFVYSPEMTFQKQADGVYLKTGEPLESSDIGELDDIKITADDLRIAPVVFSGTTNASTSIGVQLPADWEGQISGSVSTVVSRLGTEFIVFGDAGVQATKISITLNAQLTGWADVHDGDGPVSGTVTAAVTITTWAVPGVGMVRIDQYVTGHVVDDTGEDYTETYHTLATLTGVHVL